MNYPSLKPSDRSSRRQVSIYVDVETNAIIRSKAAREDVTVQEVVAKAINLALAQLDLPAALNPVRLRVFRRMNRPAAQRTSPKESRNGKVSLSGWYDRKEVQALGAICEERGVSSQALGADGLRLWLGGVDRPHALQE